MGNDLASEPNLVILPVERTRTEYVTRTVNVHEHRAPTDESVQLLREMEAKAEAEVIKSVHVGDTTFECVVHHVRDDFSDCMVWRAVFKLNGKPLTATTTTNARDASLYPMGHAKDAFVGLRDEMAKVIAAEVLNQAFLSLMRDRLAHKR